MSEYRVKFPRMTRDNTGLGPNPVVGGRGGMAGGTGGAPIAFSANFDGLANGFSVPLDTGTLQSGFRTPYFIDEIRMQVYTEPYLVAAANWSGIGGCIRAKFQTGNRAFSKAAVPVGAYAPVFSYQDFGAVQAGDLGDGAVARGYSYVRWPLPKPLWMAPGDVIQATFEYIGLGTPDAGFPEVNGGVTYVGRAIAPGTPPPDMRQIPWVSFLEYVNNTGYQNSTDQFRNPFTQPMLVQRFTSRTFSNSVTGAVEEMLRGQTPGVLNASSQFVSCRMDDSLGYNIAGSAKQFAPIGLVFDTARHAWTFSRSLGAREQFNLTLRTDDVNGVAPIPVGGWRTFTGMVGYRDEVRE